MVALAAPKAVSPFIRFCRYAALGTGILYGAYRFRSLSKKEVKIQEHESKIRAERAARLKAEKDRTDKFELDDLAEQIGIRK